MNAKSMQVLVSQFNANTKPYIQIRCNFGALDTFNQLYYTLQNFLIPPFAYIGTFWEVKHESLY